MNEAGLAAKTESNDAQLKLLEGDGIDDGVRAALESSLALTWAAAKAMQTKVAADLAHFVEDPLVALKSLEEAERDAGATYEKALGEAKTHLAQLEMQANLGSYGKLVTAEDMPPAARRILLLLKCRQAQLPASLVRSSEFKPNG